MRCQNCCAQGQRGAYAGLVAPACSKEKALLAAATLLLLLLLLVRIRMQAG